MKPFGQGRLSPSRVQRLQTRPVLLSHFRTDYGNRRKNITITRKAPSPVVLVLVVAPATITTITKLPFPIVYIASSNAPANADRKANPIAYVPRSTLLSVAETRSSQVPNRTQQLRSTTTVHSQSIVIRRGTPSSHYLLTSIQSNSPPPTNFPKPSEEILS